VSGRNVITFIGTRAATALVLLVVISFAVFSLLHLAPGDPERLLLGSQPATPATLAALRSTYHLDQPFVAQYWLWLTHALGGDFGNSVVTSQPVMQAVLQRLPVTAFLVVYAFVLTVVLGVSLGIAAALKRESVLDRAVVGASVVGVGAPAFAVGVLLLYVFAVHWSLFPAFGAGSGFTDRLWHLTLPAVALAFSGAALVVKVTRTAMIESLRQDYVVFARARGLSRRRVLLVYALRNALIPVVTSAGLILAYLVTGTVVIEVAFGLPGLGQLLVTSVSSKDIPVVQGVAVLIAAAVIAVNLLTDIAYVAVDPRIRFEGAAR
jgi:peptide/nickel transport system permease protein